MRVLAVVPVRSLREGKSRLSGVLSPRRRAQLMEEMLGRVLAALRAASRIDEVWVVTPEESLELPSGVGRLHDHGLGLNSAVELAVQHLSERCGALVVVAADTPQVTPAEIDRLVNGRRISR